MDAFVEKLELEKLGFTHTVHKSEGRPPCAPAPMRKATILDITDYSLPFISVQSLPVFQSIVYHLEAGLKKVFQSKVYHL
jgi:hypothetical protein